MEPLEWRWWWSAQSLSSEGDAVFFRGCESPYRDVDNPIIGNECADNARSMPAWCPTYAR